jgi:DNA mismatch repair ATPase MutS
MKVHLLYPDRDFDFGSTISRAQSDVVQDLELDGVFDAMALGDKYLREVCSRVMLGGMTDAAEVRYRQAILEDFVACPDMLRELYQTAVQAIEDRKNAWGLWGRSSKSVTAILSGSVRELELYASVLRRLRTAADTYETNARSEGLLQLFASLRENLDEDYFNEIDQHLKHLRFDQGVLMSAELGGDNTGIDFVLRVPKETKKGLKERLGFGPKNSYTFSIHPRDEAGARILEDLRSRGINLVANAVAQSADHIESYFAIMRSELGFYAGCVNLRSALKRTAGPLCYPDPFPLNETVLHASDLRDASLTLHATGRVVGNDVTADGCTLVVVTGANSGGKSTFLRSLGLAMVMMQAGMYVCAASFGASVCTGLFTHFIRKEDESMESGRLDDELVRMSATADQLVSGSTMLFNESFATTAEREGSEIARQVIGALLDSSVRVLFVTHQYDLAESLYTSGRADHAVFLRAEREEDGRRSFKMVVHEPLPTSYGQDLYVRIFASATPEGAHA